MSNKWKEYIDAEIGHLKKPNRSMQLVAKSITGSVLVSKKGEFWCPEEDSNLHSVATART